MSIERFPPNSRYNGVPTAELAGPDGEKIVYLRRRFIPDPATLVRLGACYGKIKKYDEGITALDRALSDPQAAPIVKQAATQEKMAQLKLKADAAK